MYTYGILYVLMGRLSNRRRRTLGTMMIAMGTAGLPDYEGAKAYALGTLARDLPSWLEYHSLWHTRDEVAPLTEWLARQEGLSRDATVLVGTAAYFHDIGFTCTFGGHEDESVRIAAEALPHYGYTPHQVQVVQRIINATRLPQVGRDILEKIIADADLDVLGRADYMARNLALRAEKVALGEVHSDEVWYPDQLRFLQQHRYFTQTASSQRKSGKRDNLRRMLEIVADCCPSYPVRSAALPAPRAVAP